MRPSQRLSGAAPAPAHSPRRGVALVFVLVFITAMAALAVSAIFLASNATLLAKSYDRERDLRFAAEAALAIGKSRVNMDPGILSLRAGQLDTALLRSQPFYAADGRAVPGIAMNVYVGPSGSTSGQLGRFSSIVAEARDQAGNGYIRRLELTQESFAKYAYWSNRESNGSQTIYFNNADELWGPVWSNDTIHIGSGGARFHDEVGTARVISGVGYGTFEKGKKERQKAIALPTTTVLGRLIALATSAGWNIDAQAPGSNDASRVLDRIEFVAADMNGANDSTDLDEGFFRVYSANPGMFTSLRGDWPDTAAAIPSVASVTFCGDFHPAPAALGGGQQFYPASVHPSSWFRDQLRLALLERGVLATTALSQANAEQTASLRTIMQHPEARCYPAGDPHLAAVDRLNMPGYTLLSWQRGGTDSTFTPRGRYGQWRLNPATPNAAILAVRPKDGRYLFPISRIYNQGARGVIYADGNIGLSGVLNGRITMYVRGTVVLLDDVRYANDPVMGCHDMLGLIADDDVVIADNAINTPQMVANGVWQAMDDSPDFYLHGVMMALGTSFRAENHDRAPTDATGCDGTANGRGCIYLSGGIIQDSRGPVGQSNGTGFAKRYSYDHCAVVNPPPHFPTTGRLQDNRYIELDPNGFDPDAYFRSITPDP